MGPSPGPSWWLCERLPRASGDGPIEDDAAGEYVVVAPRERGWALSAGRRRRFLGGCPARAGMGPLRPACATTRARLPRASGDGPRTDPCCWTPMPVAPRERGWAPPGVNPMFYQDGCPARAGMGPASDAKRVEAERLPRASGDGPPAGGIQRQWHRVAPRERGWALELRHLARQSLGCPARAGMGPRSQDGRQLHPRLPRASGDGPCPISAFI